MTDIDRAEIECELVAAITLLKKHENSRRNPPHWRREKVKVITVDVDPDLLEAMQFHFPNRSRRAIIDAAFRHYLSTH